VLIDGLLSWQKKNRTYENVHIHLILPWIH